MGEHSTEGAIFEILCKRGTGGRGGLGALSVSFLSEGNSMSVRGYTVYVYIIYIIDIHLYTDRYTYIWIFSCDWKGIVLRSNKILGNFLDSALLVLIITVVVIVVVVNTTFAYSTILLL